MIIIDVIFIYDNEEKASGWKRGNWVDQEYHTNG